MPSDRKLKSNVMKRNFRILPLMVSVLVLVFALTVSSCKKKDKDEPQQENTSHSWAPEPENGEVPNSILPASLYNAVTSKITIYSGSNPAHADGQFVSSPHHLFYSTMENDTVSTYNDRYIAFVFRNGRVDFYGKQWDDSEDNYYEEVYRDLYPLGNDSTFTCYYLTEGWQDGYYCKQSTIFSGKWKSSYGGLKDFKVAVILLENGGHPYMPAPGAFRVLGDADGLARDTNWMAKKAFLNNDVTVSDKNAFSMFIVK